MKKKQTREITAVKLEQALSIKLHKKAVAVMEEAIFGTADVNHIASVIDRTINHYTAAHPVDLIFYEESSGVVLGLELDNGQRIVLKTFPPAKNRLKLEEKRTVQKSLTDQKYPLPIPITGVFHFWSGLGVLDQYMEAPEAM